jgi:hypothetical protein
MAFRPPVVSFVVFAGFALCSGGALAQDASAEQSAGVSVAVLDIDWSAAYAYAGATEQEYASLSGSASQNLYPGADTCYMPVLIPPDGETAQLSQRHGLEAVAAEIPGLRRMVFKAYDDSYAATLSLDGAVVLMNGSRVAYATPEQAGPDVTSDDYLVSSTESGIEMSFSKFGASYFMAIECDDPGGDARCSNDGFIRSIYNKLQLVGGVSSGG